MAQKEPTLEALLRRFDALSGTSDDPYLYQQAQAARRRVVRGFARLLAIEEARRQCLTFDTKCLICGATMSAQRSTRRTCSAKCRQTLTRLRRHARQPQNGKDR
jgi:predicted nucleic acid-binding Zn ribbon protein